MNWQNLQHLWPAAIILAMGLLTCAVSAWQQQRQRKDWGRRMMRREINRRLADRFKGQF